MQESIDKEVEQEQDDPTIKKYCGQWKWYNVATQETKPFYCGTRTCGRPECQKVFFARRMKLVSCLIVEYDLRRFFTLTLDRKKVKENQDVFSYIHQTWHKARTMIQRQNKNFLYVAVLEVHKNPDEQGKYWPHIHGFTNTFLKWDVWQQIWQGCGGGHVSVEGLKLGEDNAREVSEYCSKQLAEGLGKYVGKQQLNLARKLATRKTLWRSLGMKARFEVEKKISPWELLKM